MTLSQALATPVDEIMDSMELAPRNGFHLEPRCRVCRNDLVRKKVNDLLATGASYAHGLARASGTTTPSSTSVIGSRSTRSETTAGATSQSRTSPKQPTERSSNAGQRRTASTSSRAWPPRSPPLRSSRPSW